MHLRFGFVQILIQTTVSWTQLKKMMMLNLKMKMSDPQTMVEQRINQAMISPVLRGSCHLASSGSCISFSIGFYNGSDVDHVSQRTACCAGRTTRLCHAHLLSLDRMVPQCNSWLSLCS